MGEQFQGRMLNLAEIEKEKKEIHAMFRENLIARFRADPVENTDTGPTIYDAGCEIEGTFLDKENQLTPLCDKLRETLGDKLVQEVCQYHGEMDTGSSNLFNLAIPLNELERLFHKTTNPVARAAAGIEGKLAFIGGHPEIDQETITSMWNQLPRYIGLKNNLSPFSAPVDIPFANGSKQTKQGIEWEGYGASLQTTIKVPPKTLGAFHDAYTLIGPLLLSLRASSAFLEGKATNLDSTRAIILPPSCYGFSEEDRARGRPGRWRMFDPLTTLNPDKMQWFDRELYETLKDENVDSAIAAYFGQISADGHLLIPENKLREGIPKDPKKLFLQKTSWPFGRVRYNGVMDSTGIGLELRLGEIEANPHDMATSVLADLAILQGVAEKVYSGELKPLPRELNDYNIKVAAKSGENPNKNFYWPNNERAEWRTAKDLLRYVGDLAVKVLESYGHSESDIMDILNPTLTRAGIQYLGNNTFKELENPSKTPAQLMRSIAYARQPKLKKGEKITEDTRGYMLEPFIQNPELDANILGKINSETTNSIQPQVYRN
jgi:hypothetical protein